MTLKCFFKRVVAWWWNLDLGDSRQHFSHIGYSQLQQQVVVIGFILRSQQHLASVICCQYYFCICPRTGRKQCPKSKYVQRKVGGILGVTKCPLRPHATPPSTKITWSQRWDMGWQDHERRTTPILNECSGPLLHLRAQLFASYATTASLWWQWLCWQCTEQCSPEMGWTLNNEVLEEIIYHEQQPLRFHKQQLPLTRQPKLQWRWLHNLQEGGRRIRHYLCPNSTWKDAAS